MKNASNNSIAKNIKKYRLLNHMTQENLAQKLYLDTQYYAQLERGERSFTIEKILLACSVFHVGIEDIIEIDVPDEKNSEFNILKDRVFAQIELLTYSQLQLVEKFINEIIPYCK